MKIELCVYCGLFTLKLVNLTEGDRGTTAFYNLIVASSLSNLWIWQETEVQLLYNLPFISFITYSTISMSESMFIL